MLKSKKEKKKKTMRRTKEELAVEWYYLTNVQVNKFAFSYFLKRSQ